MILTREQLYNDIVLAYQQARKHKSSKIYVIQFDFNLEDNLQNIVDELYERRYITKESTCFIVEDPKKREVFAANFRDRIVQHLYYNYTNELFERVFIFDSYSCRKNKGTLFGVKRLNHHIRSESSNWTKPCYCLQLDIKGYFMGISRDILYQIVCKHFNRFRNSIYKNEKTFDELLDFDFLFYLTKEIIMIDPTKNCIFKSSKKKWIGLPDSKSLFKTEYKHGLPIGNLTSQLFSNIYLNELDQFVKRKLKFKHYGRYVDDAYIVSTDKEKLRSSVKLISDFLINNLELKLQLGKTKIVDVKHGVQFCGAFVKPYRIYIANKAFGRMKKKLNNTNPNNTNNYDSVIQSYLGMLSHYSTYKIQYSVISQYNKKLNYFTNIEFE